MLDKPTSASSGKKWDANSREVHNRFVIVSQPSDSVLHIKTAKRFFPKSLLLYLLLCCIISKAIERQRLMVFLFRGGCMLLHSQRLTPQIDQEVAFVILVEADYTLQRFAPPSLP